jgi:recombination protein RecT
LRGSCEGVHTTGFHHQTNAQESQNQMSTQLSKPNTIESMLASPQIRQRFNEMLGQRAPQFISSIITVYRGFSTPVDPASVIASAAIAATLDLPIEKNLGFAHIVPYAGVAQFQMGAKGLTQLALRSNQYAGMNAVAVNAECFGGYDNIGICSTRRRKRLVTCSRGV